MRPRLILAAALLAAALPAAGRAQSPSTRRAAPADSTPRAGVEGIVFDSLSHAPLAGATVQLAADDSARAGVFSATTDSTGHYRISGVQPGRYLAGFFHPMLDSLGLEMPVTAVTVDSGGATPIDLAIPSAERLAEAYCGSRATGGSGGVLVGLVYDADNGTPMGKAKVVVTWREVVVDARGMRLANRRLPVMAGESGFYVACGLPTDEALEVDAQMGRRHSGIVEVRVPPRGLLRRSFALGDSTTAIVTTTPPGDTAAGVTGSRVLRGSASLAGTVRDAAGRPIDNAQVMVWGSAAVGRTDERGAFTLGNLPAGTYSLDVRALGYAPKRVPVDLASRRTSTVTAVLDERATVLSTVTVVGKESRAARDLTGFAERRERGFGKYVTREDIERRQPFVVSDLLRTLGGGVQVARGPGFDYVVRGRNGCSPAVAVDGVAVFQGADDLDAVVKPQDVQGIEVYMGAGGIPGQYASYANGCGLILIWTGR